MKPFQVKVYVTANTVLEPVAPKRGTLVGISLQE